MKHLILDCGGVLVYPSVGEWNLPYLARELLGPRAADIGTPRYERACREAAGWLDEAQLVGDVEAERRLRRSYIRDLNARMDWGLTPAEIERLGDDFTDNILRYGFFDDIEPWLRRWKGSLSLGILSDAMPSILVFLERRGILALFDAAVISTQVGAIKPDLRMYAAIRDALGADPGDCLFVDDRPGNLVGAVRAGFNAAQMARPGFFPSEGLWDGAVVDGFEALNALLEA